VLCDAALGLFLRAGIESVTIDEITRGAKMAKGSFYRYFEDKAQLVEALLMPLSEAFRSATDRAQQTLANARTKRELEDAYRRLALELSETLLPRARLVELYLQESRAPTAGARAPVRRLADEVTARAIDLTRVARERGLLRDLPPRVTALGVVGAVETLLYHYIQGRAIGEPGAASEALVSMILEGVQARSRRRA
jgi:AcrR family transcriptional regulator